MKIDRERAECGAAYVRQSVSSRSRGPRDFINIYRGSSLTSGEKSSLDTSRAQHTRSSGRREDPSGMVYMENNGEALCGMIN